MSSTSNSTWHVVATFSDGASAHAVSALFRAEGVPAKVVSDTSLLGEARSCEIQVPRDLAHRARWLMSQAQFTDAELTFLATGSSKAAIMPNGSSEKCATSNNRFERSRGPASSVGQGESR
jgi:hypothetical protein